MNDDPATDKPPAEILPAIQPEPLPVAGPVTSMEELASVQQIAFVSQWMRFFSGLATPKSPQL